MTYTVYYHIKGYTRKDILKGLAFNVGVNTDGAELEDRELMVEFLAWMKKSGRRVVEVTTPESCYHCAGWTSTRQSVYSPKRKRK